MHTVSGHSASKTEQDDYQVVKDFLAEFDLRKVAQAFRSIRSRLETIDITERFMPLVEAATCVGPVSYTHLDVYKRQILYCPLQQLYAL